MKKESKRSRIEPAKPSCPKLSLSKNRIKKTANFASRANRAAMSSPEISDQTFGINLPGIVYRLHLKGENQVDLFNDLLLRMTGYRRIPSRREKVCILYSLILKNDRSMTVNVVKKALNQKQPFEVEYRIRRKDGQLRYFLEMGTPVYYQRGKPETVDGLIIDITKYKRAEEALRESEERYRRLFERAPFGIGMTNLDGKILASNKMLELIMGFSEEELKAINVTDTYVNPNDRAELLKTLKISGGVVDYPALLKRKDGTEYNASLTIGIVNFAGKNLLQTLVQDVTERFEAAQKREALLREREILLKEVLHRVKNNFQIASSLLGIQASETEDEKTRQILLDSRERIRSMAAMHESLYWSDNLGQINFSRYARNLVDAIVVSYGSPVRIDVRYDLEKVKMDFESVVPCGLILNELVTNAMKYAFPGEREKPGRIHVSLRANPPGSVTLAVKDDGIGFSESLDFHQTRSLGMRLVYMLGEEQLKGRIECSGTNGASFRVVFPLAGKK